MDTAGSTWFRDRVDHPLDQSLSWSCRTGRCSPTHRGTYGMTDPRLVVAWQHHCMREYASAEATCRAIVRDSPDDFASWRLLAETCLAQKKHEEATTAYERAAEGQSLAASDLNNLGVALMALHRPAEAVRAYQNALRLEP